MKRAIYLSPVVVAFGLPTPAYACIGGDSSCLLTAASEPSPKAWTQPAKFEYTFNNGKDEKGDEKPDSYAIDLNGRLSLPVKGEETLGFVELGWHRNNQQAKKQNQFDAAIGAQFAFTSPAGDDPGSIYIDGKITYSRQAVFADTSKPLCIGDPTNPQCNTQHKESLRGSIVFSPFLKGMESNWSYRPLDDDGVMSKQIEGPPIVYSTGIDAEIFYDSTLNSAIDPKDGSLIQGDVFGTKLRAHVSFAPKFIDYRLNFRGSFQVMPTFSRSIGRINTFPKTSKLLTLSADFDLSDRSTDPGKKLFRPAIGVTLTDGSDPLAGKEKQQTVTIGFKLSFF